jgi:hypothetical protein
VLAAVLAAAGKECMERVSGAESDGGAARDGSGGLERRRWLSPSVTALHSQAQPGDPQACPHRQGHERDRCARIPQPMQQERRLVVLRGARGMVEHHEPEATPVGKPKREDQVE